MAASDSFAKKPLFRTLCFYHLYESKPQTDRGRLVKLAKMAASDSFAKNLCFVHCVFTIYTNRNHKRKEVGL